MRLKFLTDKKKNLDTHNLMSHQCARGSFYVGPNIVQHHMWTFSRKYDRLKVRLIHQSKSQPSNPTPEGNYFKRALSRSVQYRRAPLLFFIQERKRLGRKKPEMPGQHNLFLTANAVSAWRQRAGWEQGHIAHRWPLLSVDRRSRSHPHNRLLTAPVLTAAVARNHFQNLRAEHRLDISWTENPYT